VEEIERGEWDDRFQKQIQQTENVKEEDAEEKMVLEGAEGGVKRAREEEVEEAASVKRQKTEETEVEVQEEEEEVVEKVIPPVETIPETVEEPVPEAREAESPEPSPAREEPAQEQEEVKPEQPEPPTEPTPHISPSPLSEPPEEDIKPTTPPQEDLSDGPPRSLLPLTVVEPTDHPPMRPKTKSFSTLISPLHSSLASLRSATLFSAPIREIDAPGYSALIKKPMDLKTLWRHVKEGRITDSAVYHREVLRMFANAVMYNPEKCMILRWWG
jgi:bromodomain-containing protein 8